MFSKETLHKRCTESPAFREYRLLNLKVLITLFNFVMFLVQRQISSHYNNKKGTRASVTLHCCWDSHQIPLIFIQKYCIYSRKRPSNESSGWQLACTKHEAITIPYWWLHVSFAHKEKAKMQEEMQLLGEQILRVVVFSTTFFYRMGETAHIFHMQKNVFNQETVTTIIPKNMNGIRRKFTGIQRCQRMAKGWLQRKYIPKRWLWR